MAETTTIGTFAIGTMPIAAESTTVLTAQITPVDRTIGIAKEDRTIVIPHHNRTLEVRK